MTEPETKTSNTPVTKMVNVGDISIPVRTPEERVLVSLGLRLRRLEKAGEGAAVTDLLNTVEMVMEHTIVEPDDFDRVLAEVEANRVGIVDIISALLGSTGNREERREAAAAQRRPGRNKRRGGRR